MASNSEIKVLCKIISSLVKEDKGKADAIIITKFVGEAVNGLFKNFSKQLEEMVFKNQCWSSIKTGGIDGVWIMRLKDARTDEQFAEIKNCSINDIALKVGEENSLEIGVVVQHGQTKQQPSLEAAVSTNVMLQLEKDASILEGVDDATEEKDKSGD